MTVELTDTHCHLTSKELLPHRSRLMAEAVQAGVTRMITVASGARDVEDALNLRAGDRRLWVAAGVHPHESGGVSGEDLERLARLWRQPGVVAAGEIGLDYHYDFSPRDVQQTVFHRQLDLAVEADLPIVIHSRAAHEDMVRILTAHGYAEKPVVFHCFSGSAMEAAELRALGWWTSFTGLITFKNAAGPRQACVETPQDRLMFETDSPYLSPEPVRRMRPNEPKNLVHVVRFAAGLRGQTFDSLAAASTANAVRFFRLSSEPP